MCGVFLVGQGQEVQPTPKPQILIKTSEGTLRAELWPEAAPETVQHFIELLLYSNGLFIHVIFFILIFMNC